jgi:glutamate 5-kinase
VIAPETPAMDSQRSYKERMLPRARRAVLKVGSSILAGPNGVNTRRIASLAREICALRERGLQVMVVSSGAVAAGIGRLPATGRPPTVPQRQAAAAIGQIDLMAFYEKCFGRYDTHVAQILLTHDDLANRKRYLNARHTIETLLNAGVVPVANENDTVATDELNFGDNDNLSALVAGLIEADVLVLLSDVAGLYTRDPHVHADAKLVHVIDSDGHSDQMFVTEGKSALGTGGMASKIAAAMKASAAGIPTIIAEGLRSGVLRQAFDPTQTIGTLVLPKGDRLARRKHWIAYTLKPSGTLVLDAGAREAVAEKKRSLLPSGLREVQGKFEAGACVRCVDGNGGEIARGLVNFSSGELERIKGLHSSKIEAALGYKPADEVIHRNDLVLTGA